jgi:hypothetical protein
MKFYRLLFQLICLLVIGWTLGFWAGLSADRSQAIPMKVTTIEASSVREMADHLTDGFAHVFIHEAIVAPTVSHQIPLSFFAIIATVWVLLNYAQLTIQRGVFYYFFAWFRRLFGHQIAINAP